MRKRWETSTGCLLGLVAYFLILVSLNVVITGLREVYGLELDAPTALGVILVLGIVVGFFVITRRRPCPNCGGGYRSDNLWCPSCGHSVNQSPPQAFYSSDARKRWQRESGLSQDDATAELQRRQRAGEPLPWEEE